MNIIDIDCVRVPTPAPKLVVMGVAGAGKTTLAQALAAELPAACFEGDDFHLPASVEKMRRAIPLEDSDRAPWLARIGAALVAYPGAAIASCSALRRRYRDALRGAVPGLGFVYMRITRAQALERVAARRDHFMPPTLVASQFDALEEPGGEPATLTVDGALPTHDQVAAVTAWLQTMDHPT